MEPQTVAYVDGQSRKREIGTKRKRSSRETEGAGLMGVLISGKPGSAHGLCADRFHELLAEGKL